MSNHRIQITELQNFIEKAYKLRDFLSTLTDKQIKNMEGLSIDETEEIAIWSRWFKTGLLNRLNEDTEKELAISKELENLALSNIGIPGGERNFAEGLKEMIESGKLGKWENKE